ncbi:tRNA-splicing endonuclease subunit Sen2 isoform X2 [Betta splendens]|uniref:tRNA-splicing endonuclease subunit Sen2 n=1 Tax=Betta splendens TaxID=158456 RepID=A0A6P7MLL1_BETSP|nr:tRNA-splicing endonuclease subunit Sen2 isoform X2 [Betta splendens]
MQAEFRPPRRRPRVQEEYEAPLPVVRCPEEKCELRADLINQHVLICNPEHIQKIHNQGYFGKGVLSRARPDHNLSYQWEQYEGVFLPVVSQSRYEELLVWAGAALSTQGSNEQTVSQMLHQLSQPVEMEDVLREMGWEGDTQTEKTAPERRVSEMKPEARRGCSLETQKVNPNYDPDPDQDSDSRPDLEREFNSDADPDPDSLVLGPGFFMVVPDNEDSGGVREVRPAPYSLSEYLQLSLEEAFFLVYSLGCLSVFLHQEPLSLVELWGKFCSLRPDFISSYAAYHHFRSRGWVPKGGGAVKYGSDLMLYRKGPPFYHASYSVIIERVNGAFAGSALRPFSWRSLAALSRITTNVSKELMLCYIIYPADLSEPDLDSPECLSRLKVQEVIVSRWISSRERAELDEF